jgi:beta-glucanase (GH16 family)
MLYLTMLAALGLLTTSVSRGADVTKADIQPPRDPAYQLVWSDEFEGEGPPDPAKWKFERGFVRNDELQYYTERNAWRENGLLVIEGRRETVANARFREGARDWRQSRREAYYTSSSITTHGQQTWTYGRFEIRARFKPLQGLWPAIWTTGVSRDRVGWPHTGEIDLMEFYAGRIYANLCWAGPRGQSIWNTGSHSVERFDPENFHKSFHTWVMEWTPDRVDLYLDGQLLNRQDLEHVRNLSGPDFHPFRHPHGILLNLAIGSSGGNPSGTKFPQRYEVDYVRVWQKPAEKGSGEKTSLVTD